MQNMAIIKSYSYKGPDQLGSVVAHHAGAAGLFVLARGADVVLEGGQDEQGFFLLVTIHGKKEKLLRGQASSLGRRSIGQDLLILLREYQGLPRYSEWGTMVGVRPTKFMHNCINASSLSQALEQLKGQFHVSDAKAQLLGEIVSLQRPYVEPKSDEDKRISVYGGVPFCQTRCTYCSFPYGLIQDYLRVDDFVDAFTKDAQHLLRLVKQRELTVDSLYIGGGTPTAVDDASFRHLLEALDGLVKEDHEYTVEAGRPDSITTDKLQAMISHGVKRISLNPQTMDDTILRAIGRGHRAQDIRDLYKIVRRETDFLVNMDFIAGLPGQAMAHMVDNMDYISQAMPENVTIHTLALKRGSPLYDGLGRDALPHMQEVREMVDYGRERLLALGYKPYYLYRQQYMTGQLENIGYTLPGKECHYNIYMMEERQSVLSIGPGSSSKWMRGPDYRQLKQHMPKDVDTYIDTLETLLEKRTHMSNKFWEVV